MKNLIRIAMWSGPRNLSTALMRSFGSRDDCHVTDEPFYGSFLKRTGIDHPMANDVINEMECNYEKVAKEINGPLKNNKSIWYQKHMSHHILDGDDISWSQNMINCFLIRKPEDMLFSYKKRREQFTSDDFGLEKQLEIFQKILSSSEKIPPVVDIHKLLKDPEKYLKKLCELIEIPFSNKMLKWRVGSRESDGLWGKHWYKNVIKTTGFITKKSLKSDYNFTQEMKDILEIIQPAYKKLEEYSI